MLTPTQPSNPSARLDIDALKARLDILDVIESDLGPPKKRTNGGNVASWLCPLHGDTDPSLTADRRRQTWKCFGCQKSGDAIAWTMERERLSFREAAERLGAQPMPADAADRTPHMHRQDRHTVRPVDPPSVPTSKDFNEHAPTLLRKAQGYLWEPRGAAGLDWLHARGLSDTTLRYWGIGYNPTDGHAPWNNPEDKPAWWPSGVVIPLMVDGALAGLKVRRLSSDGAKYYVIPGSARPGVLFGSGTIAKGQPAIVCEGELDALLVYQEAGDLAAVVSGTAGAKVWRVDWTARLLTARGIVLLQDADSAGESAAADFHAMAPHARRVDLNPPPDAHGYDATDYQRDHGNLRALLLPYVQDAPPTDAAPRVGHPQNTHNPPHLAPRALLKETLTGSPSREVNSGFLSTPDAPSTLAFYPPGSRVEVWIADFREWRPATVVSTWIDDAADPHTFLIDTLKRGHVEVYTDRAYTAPDGRRTHMLAAPAFVRPLVSGGNEG